MSGNIKVVVRCRPLNAREKARGASCIIRMEGKQTIITNPKKSSSVSHQRSKHQKEEEDNIKAFTFDRSYWSVDKSDPRYASQELVYNDLGRELLDHAFDGYNCCIFAYGQTGSGKSYSMMGYGEDKGIIPRTCSELFERISYLTDDTLKFQVEVSFIEIYNEKVRDLLNPGNKGNLKVREHPTIGPYVEDLSRLVVNSFEDVDHLMNEGNKARTVAATNMNETSSRSHAVFTIFLTSSRFDSVANLTTEKASRISLVDLAGSERANSTGATGVRLKEGANINKSLTTLGKVIAALAEQSSQQSQLARRPSTVNSNAFIPYRDSVLTWLLKDSLGGNSKTAMVAAISPADYDETLSTLRYADQAKRIKNKPIVNEDPNARLIRELKEELQALRDTLMIYAPEEVEKITQNKKSGSRPGSSRALSRARAASTASPMLLLSPESPIATKRGNSLLTKEQVIDQLQSSEKLLLEVKQTWEERMRKTEEIHREREKALEELGVIVEKDNVGVYAPRSIHLINLNEDPLMTECLMYHIKPGVTRVGRLGSDIHADIRLSGPEIMDEHCYFENVPSSTTTAAAAVEDIDSVDENYHNANIVTIYPGKDSVTLVNGTKIIQPKVLHSGYRIIFGSGLHHLFRFNNPDEVRRERKHMQLQGIASYNPALLGTSVERDKDTFLGTAATSTAAINPMMSGAFQSSNVPDIVDWSFAHNEALRKFGSAEGRADLAALTDEDLKQLSEGITKMREFRNRKRISSDGHQLFFDDYDGDASTVMSPTTVSPRTSISSSSNKRFSAVSSAPTVFTEIDEYDDHDVQSTAKLSLTTSKQEQDEQPSNKTLSPVSAISREEKEQLIKHAIEEAQHQMELQKQEYEEKLKLVESSNMKADELNKEKEELASKYAQIKEEMEKTLEEQKITYESKIKRISAHLPPGTALSSDNLLVGYTSKNAAEILMRITIDKWRQLRYVKMAEDCLIHAVSLKEANIMAKELGKNVVYQFIVVHDDISANPLSFWESTSALQPFTKEPDTHLMKEAKPCLAVQVIDHVHRATYIWSILKLKQRLKRMRRLYDYTDGPLFTSQHFNREDPFYETLCPRFSLIGLARVPLQNLTLQLHADNYVDVYCRNTGKVMGQVRVLITPIARSISRKQHLYQQQKSTDPTQPKPNLTPPKRTATLNSLAQKDQQQHALGEKYLLHIGQQQVFEIRIQECIGVPESDFTQIHAQFRLSSFGNVERYSAADKVYQTDPISNFGEGSVMFNQCQTLSINITENMMDVILNQGLTIEVYGQAREKLLLGLVEHVSDANAGSALSSSNVCTGKSELSEKAVSEEDKKSGHASVNRRFSLDSRYSIEHKTYDGILMKERHDILAWIQLCELNSDGEYTPVRVIRSEVNDPHHHIKQHQDVFCLRQGLQRRISLTLTHDSGKQFEWYKIKEINISHVRLMDNKGKVIESPHHPPVEIRLFTEQTKTTFERNGISRIAVQGSWDSSLHDSVFLNRITATGQYIRLTMSWKVSTEKCTAPLQFHMDIAVLIHGRDSTMYTPSSSSSMLFRQFLLGGSDSAGSNANKKVVRKASGMFTVQLKPPLTRHVRELWRLNTSNKYVRGEEFIGSWKPRGVLLITEYREARRRMLHRETVAAFRHSLIMAGHPQTKVIQENQAKNLFSSPIEQQAVEAPHEESPEGLTRKVIDLWKSRFGTQEDIVLSQDPPDITTLTSSSSNNSMKSISSSNSCSKLKFIADIQQLYPSDTVTKRNYLLRLENVDDKWLKHWFVLRRPFIIIYEDSSETEELGVLNLTSVRVDYKPDLEEMLQRKYTFAIYTSNNSYLLQANDFEDMKDWISKIDQFYPIKKLESDTALS